MSTDDKASPVEGIVGWISMKAELPPLGVGVLVTNGTLVTVAARGEFAGYLLCWYGHGFGGYEWEYDFSDEDITHWQPLPLPPNALLERRAENEAKEKP